MAVISMFTFFVLGIFSLSATAAIDEAQAIFERWQEKGLHQPMYYREVTVVQRTTETDVTASEIWRFDPLRYRIERTNSSGHSVTVISDGTNRWRLRSDYEGALFGPAQPQPQPGLPEFGESIYVEHGHYYDQTVYIVTVERQQDQFRFWFDQKTHILWRTEKSLANGAIQVMSFKHDVTPLEGDSFPEFLTPPDPDVPLYRDRMQWIAINERILLSNSSGFPVRFPTNLPPGFTFLRSRTLTGPSGPVVLLQFQRQNQVISIFQNRGRFDARQIRALRRLLGDQSDRGITIVTSINDGIGAVIIGPLAPNVLEAIQESMF